MVRLDTMVAIFFMLSAFLLYRPMIAYRNGGPRRPKVRHFARRRFLRIYPAYWVALTVLAIYPGVSGLFTDHWWSFYSLAQYLIPVASGKACTGPGYNCGLLQSWTLTVEMTFYIMLPFFAAGTAWIARRFVAARWMRVELWLIAASPRPRCCSRPAARPAREALVPLHLRRPLRLARRRPGDGGALGRLRAPRGGAAAAGCASSPRAPLLCWAGALAMYPISASPSARCPLTVAPFTSFEYLAIHFVQCAVGIFIVLPVTFGNPNLGAPRRFLASPWLIGLGLVSYGFYLWQVTIGIELGYGSGHNSFLPS